MFGTRPREKAEDTVTIVTSHVNQTCSRREKRHCGRRDSWFPVCPVTPGPQRRLPLLRRPPWRPRGGPFMAGPGQGLLIVLSTPHASDRLTALKWCVSLSSLMTALSVPPPLFRPPNVPVKCFYRTLWTHQTYQRTRTTRVLVDNVSRRSQPSSTRQEVWAGPGICIVINTWVIQRDPIAENHRVKASYSSPPLTLCTYCPTASLH